MIRVILEDNVVVIGELPVALRPREAEFLYAVLDKPGWTATYYDIARAFWGRAERAPEAWLRTVHAVASRTRAALRPHAYDLVNIDANSYQCGPHTQIFGQKPSSRRYPAQPWPQERIEALKALLESGLNKSQAANRMGFSTAAISGIVSRHLPHLKTTYQGR